jgi:hypothetical protein
MRKITLVCGILILAFLVQHTAFAQDAAKAQETAKPPEPPAHYYRLEFLVQELSADGKPVNSRSYTGMASTGRAQGIVSVRTGSRIPVVTGSSSGSENKQVQYLDVGVNIDARDVHEVGNMLGVQLNAEISSLATPAGLSEPSSPVIRQTRWQAPVLIPVRKATAVFTSDDLDSKGSTQLTVTAIPLQ